MTRNRRPPSNVPQIPIELKMLIVQQLALEHDTSTLRNLQLANRDFRALCTEHVYEQVRFVGHPHAPDSDDTFTNEIAPLHAHLIKSVSFHPFGSTLADELLYARNFDDALWMLKDMDKSRARSLTKLQHVRQLDITMPNKGVSASMYLDWDIYWRRTLSVLTSWKDLTSLTLRPDPSVGAPSDYNTFEVEQLLASFPQLQSLRLLGIDGSSLDPDDAAYQKLQLSDLKALEISGEELGTLLCHFARMASPVTHVVLCERDELEYATLKTFLLAISPTLASLVIRQPGTFFEQQINAWEFTPTDLPNLKRLVVALEGEIAAPLARFAKLANVEVLEIGTDSPEFVKQIVRYVEDRSAWPALKELGIVCHGVDGEDWEALHVACGRRGVSLSPGFTFEADFPGGM